MKGREQGRKREKTSVRSCARARGTRGNESCVENEKEKERERKRRRRRFRFRPSGNRTRSPPFLVFDPRQILLPTFPPLVRSPPRPPLTLGRTLRRSLRCVFPSRHPYAKCIYVLCKASNRRWPREPDAQCVINTDALVVSFPPSSPPVPLLIRLLRACPVSAGPAAQAKRTARLGEYQINASTVTVGR